MTSGYSCAITSHHASETSAIQVDSLRSGDLSRSEWAENWIDMNLNIDLKIKKNIKLLSGFFWAFIFVQHLTFYTHKNISELCVMGYFWRQYLKWPMGERNYQATILAVWYAALSDPLSLPLRTTEGSVTKGKAVFSQMILLQIWGVSYL